MGVRMTGTRKATRAAATTLLALFVLGMAGGAASAKPPDGNNGTVKIHEGRGEASPEQANDPKVCGFHLHLFGLDAGQAVTFEIAALDGTAAPETGKLVANASGEAWSATYTYLPDGRYKLAVDTGDGQLGRDKHKVFRVTCGPGDPPPPDPTDPVIVS
jgi:hypothetical protein